jgi:8-oxo-dGTP pyrophosphatase MutT (NUDIX family)
MEEEDESKRCIAVVEDITNRFGDRIVTHRSDNPALIYEPTDVSTTFKVLGKARRPIPDGLETLYESSDLSFYVNPKCRTKCPSIQRDGRIVGSAIVVMINCDRAVMVRDRTRDYLTVPCGSCELDESFISAAVRECFEETGIVLNESAVKGPFAETISDITYYDTRFRVNTLWHYATVSLSSEEIEKLSSFSNEEIECVVVPRVNGQTNDPVLDPRPNNHRYMCDIVWNMLALQRLPYVNDLTILETRLKS